MGQTSLLAGSWSRLLPDRSSGPAAVGEGRRRGPVSPASSTPVAGSSTGPPSDPRSDPQISREFRYLDILRWLEQQRRRSKAHIVARTGISAPSVPFSIGSETVSMMKQFLPETVASDSLSEESDPDRISDLPDDLLLHVMDFLTLQEAVQTSLLSRKWQNLWASLMWLYIDASKFSSMGTFKNFVDNLVMYRNSLREPVPLDVFFISAICNSSDDSLEYSDIHPWICHALDSNAWTLGILKHSGPKPLSIEGYRFPFTSVHLKILALCHFLVDDCFVQRLSICCPLLEELELASCAIHVTMFSSTNLKDLTIIGTHNDKDFPGEFQYLVIDMPNLVFLILEEIPRRAIHLMNVSSVEAASIYFFSLSFQNPQVPCSIISALSNATYLTLVSPSVFEDVVPKVLQRDLQRCETFSYLKRLHLGEWFLHGGCYPLIWFLRCSPAIEKVHLQLDKSGRDDYERLPNADAEIDPPCVEAVQTFSCEKLRKITILCDQQNDKRVQIIVRILSSYLCPLPKIKIKPYKSQVSDGDMPLVTLAMD